MNERRKLKIDDWLEKGITFLKFSCVYSDKTEWWVEPLQYVSIAFNSSSSIFLTYSLYLYMDEFDKLANAAHHWLIMAVVVLIVRHYRKNRDLIDKFVLEMRTTFMYGDWFPEEEVEKIQMRRSVWNMIAVRFLWAVSIHTYINVAALGILEKLMGDSEFYALFPCWVPLNLDNLVSHIIFVIWESVCVQTTIFVIFGLLASQFYVYSFIYSELIVLLAALKRLKELDNEFETKMAIKEIVVHHQTILKSFQELHTFLGLPNLVILTCGVAVMTITGFALISDNTSVMIKFLGIMLTELVFTYISCRLSQDITDASFELRHACYCTDWMSMDPSTVRNLQLMAERALRPLSFITLTGHELSLEMYMSMIKAAYSYFNMMLRQK